MPHVEGPLDLPAGDSLAAGDHFAGMPTDMVTGDAVIQEIVDEIDAGNAHLMTRNELVEFMQWWVNHRGALNANAMIYEAMDHTREVILDATQVQTLAKEFFIEKGYE